MELLWLVQSQFSEEARQMIMATELFCQMLYQRQTAKRESYLSKRLIQVLLEKSRMFIQLSNMLSEQMYQLSICLFAQSQWLIQN